VIVDVSRDVTLYARRRMVRSTGAQASMEANQIESSSPAMTSSDDVMKLNGDVTMPLHNAASAALSERDVTATLRDGGAGWAWTAMKGAS